MSSSKFDMIAKDDESSEPADTASLATSSPKCTAATLSVSPEVQKSTYQTPDERLAAMPSHPALSATGTTLSTTLDFTPPSSYYLSPAFADWRTSLLTTLPQYLTLSSKLHITLIYPSYRTQSLSLKLTQREVVKSAVGIIRQWPVKGIKGIEVVFMSPVTDWSQVQALVPFYGLKFRGWVCRIREGEKAARRLVSGGEWDTKLRGQYRKEMGGS
ncbi:uncharacterized protein PAC_12565 [Phialocephala subalpina]|uniref:Uncharacterized protein n=1 Tax=Phialocephala subalpina TaxID=576137 RepID=A0A1L7XCC2_9HELO|nr:uncharacterized protein PAC_12565 [Phialocephala subalpina]